MQNGTRDREFLVKVVGKKKIHNSRAGFPSSYWRIGDGAIGGSRFLTLEARVVEVEGEFWRGVWRSLPRLRRIVTVLSG